MRNVLATTAFAAIAVFSATPAQADDLYLGTLSVQGDLVTLERCDLNRVTYVLEDAPGGHALLDFRSQAPAARGLSYAEVYGRYTVSDGSPMLVVSRIENVQPNKSCHLANEDVGVPPPQSGDGDVGGDAQSLDGDRGDDKSIPLAMRGFSD